MNRQEYLDELHKRIQGMPKDELLSALRFYSEYFDDAGVENEQQIMQQLGTPDQLAKQIIGEQREPVFDRIGSKFEKKKLNGWKIAMLALMSPFWLPLGAAAFMLVVALGMAVLMLMLSLVIVCAIPIILSATFVASGVFMAGCGVTVIFQSIPTTMVFAGIGAALFAGGLMMFRPSLSVFQWSVRQIFKVSGSFTRRFRHYGRGGQK